MLTRPAITALLLTLVVFVDNIRLPTCNVKESPTRERPCAVFEPCKDCCSLDFILGNNESVITHNITAKRRQPRLDRAYTPATISIPSTPNITNKFVLMLNHRPPEECQICWSVQLQNVTEICPFEKVIVRFVLKTVAGWSAFTYTTEECDLTSEEDSSENNNDTLPCVLRSIITSFKPISSRRLEFSLEWNDSAPLELEVSLLSADVNITCGNQPNNNTVHPILYSWTNVSEPWRQRVDVGYHCLRISVQSNSNCLIYTETTFIEDVKGRLPVPVSARFRQLTRGLTIATCCVCVALLLITAYRNRDQFGFSTITVPPGSPPLLAEQIKILLLYSRDSDEFCELVRSFKHLLELVFEKVEICDPFDNSEFDMITRNSEAWLSKCLYSRQAKVVFISSEGAALRQNALASGQLTARDPHCLDNIFTSALNHLRNPLLCNDYTKIFVIRFEDLPCTMMPIGITPFRVYKLLLHLEEFSQAITGLESFNTFHTVEYNRKYISVVEDFNNALERVKQHRESHPDFLLHKWCIAANRQF